jgi:hypothetical protein
MTITATSKDSMTSAVRRAMSQADCNNKSVRLEFKGQTSMVYPNDSPNKIMKHLTTQKILARIRELDVKLSTK